MDRRKPSEYPQEVFDLFDQFVHGDVSRREFIDRAAKVTVGGMSGAALLASLAPNFAWAQQVPPNDSRIKAERVEYPSTGGVHPRPVNSWSSRCSKYPYVKE